MALNAFRSFNLHQLFDPEPCHATPKGWSDEAHLEMRAAGRRFGLMAADLGAGTSHPAGNHGTKIPRGDVAEHIRSRACRLSDSLRNEHISPRRVEDLITTWVSAAHEAACERLRKQMQ
jgi:hypothetical protein